MADQQWSKAIKEGRGRLHHLFNSLCKGAKLSPNPDALDEFGNEAPQLIAHALLIWLRELASAQLSSFVTLMKLAPSSSSHGVCDDLKPVLTAALAENPDDNNVFYHQFVVVITREYQRHCNMVMPSQLISNKRRNDDIAKTLLEEKQTLDPRDSNKRRVDLFQNLDQPSFDARANFVTFLVDQKKELPLRCAKWALPACRTLMQLANETRIAADLLEFQNWDNELLEDALASLHYSIYDFLGPIVGVLQVYCIANGDRELTTEIEMETFGTLKTFGEVGGVCSKCRIDVEIAFIGFIAFLSRSQTIRGKFKEYENLKLDMLQSLRSFKDSLDCPVASKVPTATFTELVIRNQAMPLETLISTLDRSNVTTATDCISEILNAQNARRSEYPMPKSLGIPRCVTIVVDTKNEFVTTGATQPAYDDEFPWLKKMGKKIHSLRIGETFRHAAHLCSENVFQLTQEGKPKGKDKKINDLDESSVNQVYREFMEASKQSSGLARLPQTKTPDPMPQAKEQKWYSRMMSSDQRTNGYGAIPGLDSTVFCWAFDPATANLKPSCLRCQRMYSAWFLYGNPEDSSGKMKALEDFNARDALKYEKKTDTCTYCAETIAAAKLHLLRNGPLG